MPLNYRNDTENSINTFNNVVQIVRYSNNKYDAIKSLKDTTINGTDIKIGETCAHQIYNKYVEYNGNCIGRCKKF